MVCIYCGEKTKTTNSRSSAANFRTWRRRQCISCQAIFTTEETADLKQSLRVKNGASLRPFIYEKLFLDVYESLSHRKTAYTDAKGLTDTIILKLLPCKSGIIQNTEVKETALEVLKRFDSAAFTYYKSHHLK